MKKWNLFQLVWYFQDSRRYCLCDYDIVTLNDVFTIVSPDLATIYQSSLNSNVVDKTSQPFIDEFLVNLQRIFQLWYCFERNDIGLILVIVKHTIVERFPWVMRYQLLELVYESFSFLCCYWYFDSKQWKW